MGKKKKEEKRKREKIRERKEIIAIGMLICLIILVFQEMVKTSKINLEKKEEIKTTVNLENKIVNGPIEEYHSAKIQVSEELKKTYMEMLNKLEEENKKLK